MATSKPWMGCFIAGTMIKALDTPPIEQPHGVVRSHVRQKRDSRVLTNGCCNACRSGDARAR
jgi:hypothetical protein